MEEDNSEQRVSYSKIKEKGIIECDVTRFKSWIGKDRVLRKMYIEFKQEKIPFIDIISKSTIVSSVIKGDFERNILVGEFDIIGHAKYYVDIKFGNQKIAEKIEMKNGHLEVSTELMSGKYNVTIFEEDEDDTGFGDMNLYTIGEVSCELLNPYDLQGKSIQLLNVKKGKGSIFNLPLSCNYKITRLYSEIGDLPNIYWGRMIVESSEGSKLNSFMVNVEFCDMDKLKYVYISFYRDEELSEFLYDYDKGSIVKDEIFALPPSVKYRRYEPLYKEDEYVYSIMFIDYDVSEHLQGNNQGKVVNLNKSANTIEKDSMAILVEDLKLSDELKHCLKRSNIANVMDICNLGYEGLHGIRHIKPINIRELQNRLRQFKIEIPHCANQRLNQPSNNNNEKIINTEQVVKVSVTESEEKNIIENHIEVFAEQNRNILDTPLSESGLHPLIYNKLKMVGLSHVRDIKVLVEGKGIKGLNSIQLINASMKSEIIDVLRKFGII